MPSPDIRQDSTITAATARQFAMESIQNQQGRRLLTVERALRDTPLADGVERRGAPDNPTIKDVMLADPPETRKLYEAISDATWNDSDAADEHWEVVVQRVKQDGTLDADSEVTKRAVGVESGGAPVLAEDRCIETVSADGKRVATVIAGEGTHDVFRLRVSGTEIQAYLPAIGTATQGHVLYNRQPCAPLSPLAYNSDNGGWADTGLTLSTAAATVHVFAQVAIVGSPSSADHTQAGFTNWHFSETGGEDPDTDGELGYGYIGSVTESSGAYIIRQHRTGQLRIDRDDGDSRVNALLTTNAIRRQHTIERMSGNAGAFQLADVDSLPEIDDAENAHIVLVEDVEGVRRNKFLPMADLPSGDQLNHSFLPSDNGDETFDMTAGLVYVGELGAITITSLDTTDVDFSAAGKQKFEIKIDWSSDINSPTVTWQGVTAFGNNATNPLIRYYPILEFGTAGDFSTLIRRQTSDIHAPTYPIPEMPSTSVSRVLVWNDDSGVFEWVAAGSAYSVLQTKSDGTIGFDYVRVMA